jgi:mRNA-degrading endonuclease RelE of RelBE toxin-antitoxin system
MLDVRLHKQAAGFLEKIPTKHARQIVERITLLQHDQSSILSEDLKGFAPFKRFKSGEYRVVFFVEDATLHIPVIGKRNDDEVYDLVKRFLR